MLILSHQSRLRSSTFTHMIFMVPRWRFVSGGEEKTPYPRRLRYSTEGCVSNCWSPYGLFGNRWVFSFLSAFVSLHQIRFSTTSGSACGIISFPPGNNYDLSEMSNSPLHNKIKKINGTLNYDYIDKMRYPQCHILRHWLIISHYIVKLRFKD